MGTAVLTIVALFQTSCSTDFELNAPYEEIPVVYALLDQTDQIQMFTIRKSFLGAGSAYQFATVSDSSEYAAVDGTVKEYIDGVATGNEWTLQDTIIENKEEGQFYSEGAKAYFFKVQDSTLVQGRYVYLNEEAEYRLEVSVNESGDKITGSTTLVKSFSVSPPFSFPNVAASFARSNSSITGEYPNVQIEWNSSPNSRRYELKVLFKYTEFYDAAFTDSAQQVVEWGLGTQKTLNDEGNEQMLEIIEGITFYELLRDNIANDPSVTRRVPRGVDFIFTVAGEDLHTYMEVNEPSTGIVQERPEYTNIGNGIGIFSSRYVQVLSKSLDKNSTKELCSGPLTSGLGFCSDRINWQNENWYCN